MSPAATFPWREPTCRDKQIDDLLIGVEVRRQATPAPPEGVGVGHVGAWLDASSVLGELEHGLDALCPRQRRCPLGLVASPMGDELSGQWTAMAGCVGEACERLELASWYRQREAEITAAQSPIRPGD